MRIKVLHLIRRLERIERDLEELQNLQDAIQVDRAYAEKLKESMVEESIRLKSLRNRILTQVVKEPPAELITGHSNIQTNDIQIHLPGKTLTAVEKRREDQTPAKASRPESKDKVEKPVEKKETKPTFQFKYD